MAVTSCQNKEVASQLKAETKSSNVVIAGESRRKTVGSTIDKSVYRKVGQLKTATIDPKTGMPIFLNCSAALISKNIVVTAAHCAFASGTNDLLANTYFYPSINEAYKYDYGRYPVVKAYYPRRYDNVSPEANYDMAILELGKGANKLHAGELVGYFGFTGTKKFPRGKTLTIGYPGDKPSSVQFFESGCNIEDAYRNRLDLECDVYKGQSGSPIFVYSEKVKAYSVHGVITSESRKMQMNYGTNLSRDRFYIIKDIITSSFDERKDYGEDWIENEIRHDEKVNVLIKNTCPTQDVLIARYFQDDEGNWDGNGFYTVKSGETRVQFRTSSKSFYIHARKSGKAIIKGMVSMNVPNSGSFDFKEYRAEDFGDYVINIPCASK